VVVDRCALGNEVRGIRCGGRRIHFDGQNRLVAAGVDEAARHTAAPGEEVDKAVALSCHRAIVRSASDEILSHGVESSQYE
jgi:hypothetical protein